MDEKYRKQKEREPCIMQKVIVTGADGMLGRDLCPILTKNGYAVVKTDIHNMDITNLNSIESVFAEENPDIVIHCAAYTNVDKAETDITNAKLINSTGTENIAKMCEKYNATLIYISTDYVFDGTKNTPYLPSDKPNPINNYGLTKLWGEQAVQTYCSKYYITRTSWLYGIYGKNFIETMLSLADKQELKVVDDQTGCPTWTIELINGILKLLKTNSTYGIYHVCGSNFATWYVLAKKIFALYNLEVNLVPCTTEEFPRPAKRPKYSVMANDGICRDWQEALAEYVKIRGLQNNERYSSSRR